MKKFKVIIASRNLTTGGIESSFINFIDNVKDIVDLDAFLCNNCGALKEKMNADIKLYEGNKFIKFFTKDDSGAISNSGKVKKFKSLIRKVIKFIYNKFGIKRFLKWFSIVSSKRIDKHYDCAICFYAQNEICSRFVLKKIKAKTKFAVIHADVSKYSVDKKVLKPLYKYDKILCVSQSCAEIFKSKYPQLVYKVDYLYNFQDCNKIILGAEEFKVDYPNTFNIVTVARLSESEKGIIRSLEVFKDLYNEGYKFHWHIVGDGADRNLIESYIKLNNMETYITLHGNQTNPYPYIKQADLFYLGSYHESWGIVIIEALTLGVPVLTTRTSSATEILGDKCFICENDKQFIYDKLKFVFENQQALDLEKNKIQEYKFDNETNRQRLLLMINDK